MSVLIKGIKRPKDCDTCKLSDIIDCKLWKIMDVGEIHPECPLTELPEKHGRLIDGDEFFRQMNTAIAMMSGMMKAIGAEDDEGMQMELKAYRDIRDGIKDCDAVIEAEDEGWVS